MGPRWCWEVGRFARISSLTNRLSHTPRPDPRWANPIKDRVRQTNQARAINEVVNALKPSQYNPYTNPYPQLRVVNGISTPSSSILTTAAQENFPLSPAEGLPPGRPGNSTIRWAGGLQPHPEIPEHDEEGKILPDRPPRQITPSLATLEKAVAARIYFENLYFPLLRHTPSREQRRLAMEKDMSEMRLSEAQKDILRARWRQNETDYLRDRRRKVDVSAFRKLKTIGHGLGHSSSLFLPIHFPAYLSICRCLRSCIPREGTINRQFIRYEGGTFIPRLPSFHRTTHTFINFILMHDSCERQTCCVKLKKVTFELNEIF
jgi:hypothetical protein